MNIIFGFIFVLSIILDQVTKVWATNTLRDGSEIKIIDEFFRLSYVENRGAAFGMLQNKIWFFVLVTIIMLVILAYIFFVNKNLNILSKLSLTLIAGGAIGNFIDRVRLGYVVDFLDVRFGSFYDFPVFNVADSFVVCGTILLMILVFSNKFEKSENINE
ncbi:MAG: signal peptidase II [Tissierellia bacterium]|nr:signal peptidase II [Tissierellia bacterium]MDD4781507.1 signal peptidase II [Tissierellia bacterium]